MIKNPFNKTFINFHSKNRIVVNKHQHCLSVKAQDNITHIPPVAHTVVYEVGGIFSEGSHSGLSVVDTIGTHSIDRRY